MTMALQTDPVAIGPLALAHREENARFRALVDAVNLPAAELDGMVHRIYAVVADGIDCRECANCCRVTPPMLDRADVGRLAEGLEMSRDDVTTRYLEPCANGRTFRFRHVPCKFLEGNLCSAYESRPEVCRAYPHLDEAGFAAHWGAVLSDCEICPLAYNVFEMLKAEMCELFPKEWEAGQTCSSSDTPPPPSC